MSVDARVHEPVRDGLRAAGRYLDDTGRHLTSLSVLADGVVVTLALGDVRQGAEAILLTLDDLRELAEQARTLRHTGQLNRSADPLFPTGYEDFLRALDAFAAQRSWTWLRLVRVGDVALIHYAAGPGTKQGELALTAPDIQDLLDNAFYRRGHGPVA